MHFTLLAIPFLALTASATSQFEREILKPRNWDLRLLTPRPSNCNPNVSNIDISVFHRSGLHGRNCSALDSSLYNTTTVGSISWKSPVTTYDLCVYEEGDCGGEPVEVVRGGLGGLLSVYWVEGVEGCSWGK
ncbi:hypothetical protein AWENTII_012464 [Aspergillus wentii]